MRLGCLVLTLVASALVPTAAGAQELKSADDPEASLRQALRYGDLYNWSDAAPLFARAEHLYDERGDRRNALYAHFGTIRSTMEQLSLSEASEELGTQLDDNPLLQTDNELRLFCLIVRGDIDAEIDAAPMRRDWEAVLKVAEVLHDKKWQNRASGEIGFSLFLEGDLAAARQKVGTALMGAVLLQDSGAQMRYLSAIGEGLVLLGSYQDAHNYFEKALRIADGIPDAGYQFAIYEGKLEALQGMGKLDEAQQLGDDIIAQARARHKHVREAQALITLSTIAVAKHDETLAIQELLSATNLSESGGFKRLLADAQFGLADIYRRRGDLAKAEELAAAAAESTQGGGEIYLLPRRLQSVAELQVSQNKYQSADATYERAEDVLDTMIGNIRSAQAEIGLITSMSEIYSEHFALIVDHQNDTARAYSVLERARGRATSDLLMSGRPPDPAGEAEMEKKISRLNLELSRARSQDKIREVRDKLFAAEQARWAATASDSWTSHPWDTIPLKRIRETLASNELMLEYVVADPRSYCIVITRDNARIVSTIGRKQLTRLVSAYVKTLKSRGTARIQGSELYSDLLKHVPEAEKKTRFIVVPDGCLHLLPFDALVDRNNHYLVYSRTITYAPSATAVYLLKKIARGPTMQRTILGIGGIPYSKTAELNKLVTLRGYANSGLSDLPASKEEVLGVESAVHVKGDTLLIGSSATESAFKHSDLDRRAILHLAVHGIADAKNPQRSALILLSDPQSGEDGILEADEIVHLHTNADLVVLSACDTAVGRLQGEEGIANLSRAFLLAGAKGVVSTLWSIEDTAALYLVKRFYAHLAERRSTADALTAAKRDFLKRYGEQAIPYYWASFKLEGVGDQPVTISNQN